MKRYNAFLGFSLLELMVVVVIISLLASIAIPSYMSSVKRSNRSDAKAGLVDVAQRLQRCYTVYGQYNHDSCTIYGLLAKGVLSDGKFYTFTVASNGDAKTTFILTATASKAPQTNDTANGCDKLTLSNIGKKGTVSGGLTDDAEAACWKK